MKRFCYKCGALEEDAGPLLLGLCQRCFLDLPLLQAPAEVGVVVCRDCGAYRLRGRWHPLDYGEVKKAVQEAVIDAIRVISYTDSGKRLLRPVEVPEVQIEVEPLLESGLVKIRAAGRVHSQQRETKLEELALKLNLEYTTCDTCRLKRAKHHEAILQLRDFPSQAMKMAVREEVKKIVVQSAKVDPMNFIADIKEQPGGIDFYLSTVNLGRRIASQLKEKFGITITESAKLIGQTRDGRKKYRVSFLARFM
ncbi:MAG: NMD3-related protein [Candidatus Hadarchaeum sp.]|uniref:NMD3-related protein n=1 Tax=Candidatus Hadarchaeum sp. TaxID=2883567 RepID=UPI003D10486E